MEVEDGDWRGNFAHERGILFRFRELKSRGVLWSFRTVAGPFCFDGEDRRSSIGCAFFFQRIDSLEKDLEHIVFGWFWKNDF